MIQSKFAFLFVRPISEAQKPQIPKYPQKKHRRVHANFFVKFARIFAFFPVTRVRNPAEIVQEKLVRMNFFLFWWIFFSGGFSSSEILIAFVGYT